MPRKLKKESAEGKIVSDEYAAANPDTVQEHTVYTLKEKIEFVESVIDKALEMITDINFYASADTIIQVDKESISDLAKKIVKESDIL